jgi:formate dehydrogenase subunit gamma
MSAQDSSIEKSVLGICERYAGQPGPLLEVLHEVQATFGYVPPESVPVIAKALNLSRAEVHGVISFYHHFRSEHPGRHVIQLCRAEACQAMRGNDIARYLQDKLRIDFHGTTADGRFSLEPVYCLGNCACAPSLMLDGELHGRLSSARVDEIIAEAGGKQS